MYIVNGGEDEGDDNGERRRRWKQKRKILRKWQWARAMVIEADRGWHWIMDDKD